MSTIDTDESDETDGREAVEWVANNCDGPLGEIAQEMLQFDGDELEGASEGSRS